jgi:hypothetical protein
VETSLLQQPSARCGDQNPPTQLVFIMNSIKQLLLHTATAIALSAAGIALAQIYL